MPKMKATIACLLVCVTTLASCITKAERMTEQRKIAVADSLVLLRKDEIIHQAEEDLDHRLSIDVKAKADSIVAARMGTAVEPPVSANHSRPETPLIP